jgi:hypothetical protein
MRNSMAFVIALWLVGIGFFLAQGIYVIRSGQTTLFVLKTQHRAPIGVVQRGAYAVMYLLPALGMAGVLAAAIRKSGFEPVRKWLNENSGMLIYILLLGACGAWSLAQPASMLRWTMRTNPELADNRALLLTIRLVGLVITLAVLFMLSKL